MQTENIKEKAHQLLDNLPDSVTWEDLMYRIYVRETIEAGIKRQRPGPYSGRQGSAQKIRIVGMKVFWTLNAIKHLTNIYEYIALNLGDVHKIITF
jgi:hypothetical protein